MNAITVYEGQHVRKGDQIGMNLEFDHHGQKPGLNSKNIHINARIATVRRN